jgi:phosphonate transport system substrate-binding protein
MKNKLYLVLAIIMIAVLALSACQQATVVPTAVPTKVPTKAPTAVPTPVPPTATPEPTAIPLGSPENPIVMAQAPSATTQELITGGEAIAAKLTEMTGLSIKVVVPTNYSALVEAIGSGNAQFGWLPPLVYVLAKEKGYADVGLIVVRSGSAYYGAQYIANVDKGFTSYFDPATNTNTADAATALAQFAGKKPCWTDPLSASGYVIPLGFLQANNISVKAGAFVQGHPTVVVAVYHGGICDFGATYIDARTDKVTNETYPDVQEKVVVIWRTDPIIPNDNVAFATDLPTDIRETLTNALLELSATEEGVGLLKSGGYSISGLEAVDDTFYDDFRVYLQATGIDITTLVK